jgi:hypothetical protein
MPVSESDTLLAAATLRNLELAAADPDYPGEDRRHPHYFMADSWRRGGGLSSAFLYELLTQPQPGFSASGARATVSEAVALGHLIRVGAGNATTYRTVPHQAELDDAARQASDAAMALGHRAEAVGLRVSVRLNYGYGRTVIGTTAAQEEIDAGRLVTKATLALPLAEVVDLLEQRHGDGH